MTIDELAAALDRLKTLGAELLDRATEKLLRYELNRQRRNRSLALSDIDGYDAVLADYVDDLRSARHPIETELQAWVRKIGADKVSDFLREFRRLQEWCRDEVTTFLKRWQHRQAVSRYKTMQKQIPAEYFDDSLDVQWNESEKNSL